MTKPDLQTILADAREILSIGSFSHIVAEKGQKHANAWPVRAKITLKVAEKVGFPESGKNRGRIVSAMKPGFLYYLADPRTPRHPRYVGSTVDPVERARTHGRAYDGNSALWAWKRELVAAGLKPLLVTLARFDDVTTARRAEWRLIDRWIRRGLPLLNSGKEGSTERFGLYCQQFHRRTA